MPNQEIDMAEFEAMREDRDMFQARAENAEAALAEKEEEVGKLLNALDDIHSIAKKLI